MCPHGDVFVSGNESKRAKALQQHCVHQHYAILRNTHTHTVEFTLSLVMLLAPKLHCNDAITGARSAHITVTAESGYLSSVDSIK